MATELTASDASASDVAWDIAPLLGDETVEQMLDRAAGLATDLGHYRGRIGDLDVAGMAALMSAVADIHDAIGRAGSFAGLQFAVDTSDGATYQLVQERGAQISNDMLFIDLEWAAVGDDHAEKLLAADELAFCAHHLRSTRRYRTHLLSEPEEKILTEKDVTGSSAWVRLFDQLTSDIDVELDGEPVSLEQSLSQLASPDRDSRRSAAAAVTAGLQPGIETRAFVFNTLAADKATDDRLRSYPSWISSRNLANEATDESVQALVDAVVGRYDLPQRWYRLKAQILGYPLADYDRMASVADTESEIGWQQAKDIVLDSYASFSDELASTASKFFDGWIDAPMRENKRPGAFCAYTVPSHHPYVLLNWTGRNRDVLTLAHELGHGLHAHLARPQGVFHQATPLTLAETASVFGETVTFGRLLDATSDPNERLALLAESIEGSIATVFRQTAMNRFEHAVHTHRRDQGELSVQDFGDHWHRTQVDMLADSVEITDDYRSWWSYIPHFIGTPGYVYAYAYGQLLALSVYRRYEEGGEAFVPQYLELLRAGGSKTPEELGKIVDCDLGDPGFWDGGLAIVEAQLDAAEDAAKAAGRI
ncbi:MAG: M3 family oligoendopeptidase [Acidimicrobiales bacterium]|jgi:oligoendopeptidase F